MYLRRLITGHPANNDKHCQASRGEWLVEFMIAAIARIWSKNLLSIRKTEDKFGLAIFSFLAQKWCRIFG